MVTQRPIFGTFIRHNPFVLVMATTGADEVVTIPCQNVGTFNATINWGDGSSSTITTYNDANLAHTYAVAGDHTIRITGTFPNISFANGGDKLKVKGVLNLGDVGWISLYQGFMGCTNLADFVVGSTDTSAIDSTFAMLYNCSSLTSLDFSSFTTALVNNMGFMFWGCSGLTDIVGVEDFDIEGLDSTGDLDNFATNVTLPTSRYDALLINWDAQNPFDGMSPNFGNSKYTGGGTAAAARANLIATDGWSITDGGIA